MEEENGWWKKNEIKLEGAVEGFWVGKNENRDAVKLKSSALKIIR